MEQHQMPFDINSTTEIICESCGNDTFRPIFFLRKLSRFLAPDGNDRVLPFDSLACLKCNHVNADFNPISQLNNKKENE